MTPATLADAACAALRGDHLVVRQWAIDNLRGRVTWSELGRPEIRGDALSIAAALVELMAAAPGRLLPGGPPTCPRRASPSTSCLGRSPVRERSARRTAPSRFDVDGSTRCRTTLRSLERPLDPNSLSTQRLACKLLVSATQTTVARRLRFNASP